VATSPQSPSTKSAVIDARHRRTLSSLLPGEEFSTGISTCGVVATLFEGEGQSGDVLLTALFGSRAREGRSQTNPEGSTGTLVLRFPTA